MGPGWNVAGAPLSTLPVYPCFTKLSLKKPALSFRDPFCL